MIGTFKVTVDPKSPIGVLVYVFRDDEGNSASGTPEAMEVWKRGGVKIAEGKPLADALRIMMDIPTEQRRA